MELLSAHKTNKSIFDIVEKGSKKMVIWINGSFGVGKTSTAEALKNKFEKSIIYDPEEIGGFLSNMFNHEKYDFQDYELWRILNSDILKYMCSIYEVVIVPMTITNKNYYDEIINQLKISGVEINHFILYASKEEIINRLDSREDSTEWAYNQVDRCIKEFDKNQFNAKIINTNNLSVKEVAKIIIDSI